ncbi:hypothetical protein CPAR01_13291 [Colletotrichum paranaense]|uniref:Uncharacterized protein n=1 Tax=Colletotrichum paranaense TaxID=1914294 RepID=A0ABQ9S6M7_9PEZI|nr:uncharacterized protein CPAR01_13291 [Colletotrichum paranaense]KAK1526763.1 hypothetical protein CPAR01_13291 [Colletotrichum paranaense]
MMNIDEHHHGSMGYLPDGTAKPLSASLRYCVLPTLLCLPRSYHAYGICAFQLRISLFCMPPIRIVLCCSCNIPLLIVRLAYGFNGNPSRLATPMTLFPSPLLSFFLFSIECGYPQCQKIRDGERKLGSLKSCIGIVVWPYHFSEIFLGVGRIGRMVVSVTALCHSTVSNMDTGYYVRGLASGYLHFSPAALHWRWHLARLAPIFLADFRFAHHTPGPWSLVVAVKWGSFSKLYRFSGMTGMAAVPVSARSRFFNSILVLLRCSSSSTCSVTVPGYWIGETAKSDSANNHHLA